VHSLYPLTPFDANDDVPIPFIVSTNTCYLSPTQMTLPMKLIENIRSLTARHVHRGGNDYEFFIPVLGQMSQVEVPWDLFTFTPPGALTPTPSFANPNSVNIQEVSTKEGKFFKPLVEESINLIDGSCTSGYAFINNPKALAELQELWEEWFKQSGVSSYSSTFGTFSVDAGINALVSVTTTRNMQAPLISKQRKLERQSIEKKTGIRNVDPRFEGKKAYGLVVPYYQNHEVKNFASQSTIIAAAYEPIISQWILPTAYEKTDDNNLITVVRSECIQSEPFTNVIDQDSEGITLDAITTQFAEKMVRGKLATKDDWDLLLEEMAKKGRGGILSKIVGGLADAIIPGAGKIVNEVGGMIGI